MSRLDLRVWAVLGIWLATFLAYSNSFTIAFQFDDSHTVQMNLYVRSLKNIPQYFVDSKTFSYRPENSGYRPMTTTALALGFALSQNQTWGYHLIKLIEHCLVATLVMLVGLKLLPRAGRAASLSENARFVIAALSALVFGVHRANTETVDYISAISTLQAGLFHLLAFYLYIRFTESQSRRRRIALFSLSVLSYFASMLSKEEGITLVAMIFFYEWLFRREASERLWARLRSNWLRWAKVILPYAAVAVLFVVLRQTIQPEIAEKSRGNIPTFIYFITQFRSWLYYWKLYFWPVTLNADNLAFDFSPGLSDWRVWASLATHCAIWVAAWSYGRKHKFALFAVVWMYVTVLPASSVFSLVEAVNEHRMYIPYMLLAPLSVWLVFELAARFSGKWSFKAATAFVSVAALALGVGAYARNEVWQTDISLWEDVYKKNPDSPRAMNVLGVALLNRGEVKRSVELLERCHKVTPNYLPCIVHLSMGYVQLKRAIDARTLLQYGHSLDPDYPHMNFHLGLVYKEQFSDFVNARVHFENVIRVTDGRFFPATVKLAEISLEEGRVQEGLAMVEEVLKLDPSNGDAAEVYAKGLMLSKEYKKAATILGQLARMMPKDPRFTISFAGVHERAGYLKEARGFYAQTVTGFPDAIQAWQGLARVAEKLGEPKTAQAAREQVEKLKREQTWMFYPSMFMIGEKPGQVSP